MGEVERLHCTAQCVEDMLDGRPDPGPHVADRRRRGEAQSGVDGPWKRLEGSLSDCIVGCARGYYLWWNSVIWAMKASTVWTGNKALIRA